MYGRFQSESEGAKTKVGAPGIVLAFEVWRDTVNTHFALSNCVQLPLS